MESLFRFTQIRPAVDQDPATPSINLSQDTPFQINLIEASKVERPRDAMREVALRYVDGPDFIGNPEVTPLSKSLRIFDISLDRLEQSDTISHEDIVLSIREAFGSDLEILITNSVLEGSILNLKDSIVAIKQLQEMHSIPIHMLVRQLRDLELIFKTANDNTFPVSVSELTLYRRRPLLLPPFPVLQSTLSTTDKEKEWRKKLTEEQTERQSRAKTFFERYQTLVKAVDELTSIGGEHFQTTIQNAYAGHTPPEELSPRAIVDRMSKYHQQMSDLNLQQLKKAVNQDGNAIDPLRGQDIAGASSASEIAAELLKTEITPQTGKTRYQPMTSNDIAFRLKSTAQDLISESSKGILKDKGLVITEKPLDLIVESLRKEIRIVSKELDLLYKPPTRKTIKRIGDTMVTVSTLPNSVWASSSVGGIAFHPLPDFPVEDPIPFTKGKVTPSGIADLMIVKQQLIGYEAADIAHIENVLKNENKTREHTRRQEIEQVTYFENEVTKSEEHDLQSSNRFEMSQETDRTIKEDSSSKAGVTLSGRYGPSVEFSASAEGSHSRSKDESTSSSVSFAQEITERSAKKITERVLKRESLRVTTELTEKNSHILNNVQSGSTNISGVYQWVNKVYQAQVFNYGLRTMFDFMIPEPAAFLLEALRSSKSSQMEIYKPPEFVLKPNEIEEDKIGDYINLYGATDITPPPEEYKTISTEFKASGSKHDYNQAAQIAIDDGYEAVNGCVTAILTKHYDPPIIDFALGRRLYRGFDEAYWTWVTDLDNETKSIPFAFDTWHVGMVAVAVEIKCHRTEHLMDKWRYETHAKLTIAYKARLSEYEEKLNALNIQSGIAIQGKNPNFNLEIMNNELKKNCISIITDQHYVLFNAIEPGSNGFPQINVNEAAAEGSYVRFFEQAFEWENMTWISYPYFWGRKSQWLERIDFEDPDPLFNEFLKAGYCRVVVPARPGFESAIDHFMKYGQTWNGGPLPTISDPLYIPLADEMSQRLDRPGDEVPVGDPWIVKIPTTLIRLRPDESLPKWVFDENGNWIEG